FSSICTNGRIDRSAPASWFDFSNQIGASKIIREINGLRQAASPCSACTSRVVSREGAAFEREALEKLRRRQTLAARPLQFGHAQRATAAGHHAAVLWIGGDHWTQLPLCRLDGSGRPELDRSAVELRGRAGNGIEGADLARQQFGRLREIECGLVLGDLG